jgi:hypothetical protein
MPEFEGDFTTDNTKSDIGIRTSCQVIEMYGTPLPPELWLYIYSFDPTYHDEYNKVMEQLRRYTSLSIYIQLMDHVPMNRWSRTVKAFLRNTRKKELREFTRFYRIIIPRHTTKHKMFTRLHMMMNRDRFSGHAYEMSDAWMWL